MTPKHPLQNLEETIDARLKDGKEDSYTRRLSRQGLKRVAQKVGEEGVETALAAVDGTAQDLTGEAADLIYHLILLLRLRRITLTDVYNELERRKAGPSKG